MEKIKIGEIKCEALRLVFPELDLHFDSDNAESINSAVANLKCDPTLKGYLDSCVGAINRALSIIESKGASKTEIKTISLKGKAKIGGMVRVPLKDEVKEAHNVIAVYQNGKSVNFTKEADGILLVESQNGEAEILYNSKIPRISEKTSDSYEIELDPAILELIPYFVRSELILGEDEKGAKDAKNEFLSALNSVLIKPTGGGAVMTVYSI